LNTPLPALGRLVFLHGGEAISQCLRRSYLPPKSLTFSNIFGKIGIFYFRQRHFLHSEEFRGSQDEQQIFMGILGEMGNFCGEVMTQIFQLSPAGDGLKEWGECEKFRLPSAERIGRDCPRRLRW
jgi:hypothetical protein